MDVAKRIYDGYAESCYAQPAIYELLNLVYDAFDIPIQQDHLFQN